MDLAKLLTMILLLEFRCIVKLIHAQPEATATELSLPLFKALRNLGFGKSQNTNVKQFIAATIVSKAEIRVS